MANDTAPLSEESFAFKEVTWKIKDFLDLPREVDFYVTSPDFRFGNATWYLKLFPNGQSVHNPEDVDVYLVRWFSSVREHYVHHTIGLKTRRGREHECYSSKSTFDRNALETFLNMYSYSNIKAHKHSLLPDGTLTVFCQIRMKEKHTPEASSRPQQRQNEPSRTELQEASSQTEVPEPLAQADVKEAFTGVQKLQSDYSKLLKSEEESDVSLKVSDKEFRAHRCILRARSTVFSAMFKYETEEKASGEVVIDDLDPDSFPDFLQHVYAGRVECLSSKNVFSLYSAADKYDLQELKSECRDYMERTLSVDTFCDVITLALRHQEEELLKLAIEFFSKNLTNIIVTVKWQIFSKDYNTEANELLIKALVPGAKKDSL